MTVFNYLKKHKISARLPWDFLLIKTVLWQKRWETLIVKVGILDAVFFFHGTFPVSAAVCFQTTCNLMLMSEGFLSENCSWTVSIIKKKKTTKTGEANTCVYQHDTKTQNAK